MGLARSLPSDRYWVSRIPKFATYKSVNQYHFITNRHKQGVYTEPGTRMILLQKVSTTEIDIGREHKVAMDLRSAGTEGVSRGRKSKEGPLDAPRQGPRRWLAGRDLRVGCSLELVLW